MPQQAPEPRKGMPSPQLSETEFKARFKSRFQDPAFRPLEADLDRIAHAAWDGYCNHRKAPLTRKAGPGFADPDYDLALDWIAARDAVHAAQARHDDKAGPMRFLVINGSSRSEHTCPGEMSKSWRFTEMARDILGGPDDAEV
ncbi:MAG: NADPH-dependent reductase, partial [Phenylobacterium sp.]|nr:NADPH-dependent reductase [Phenylobacterium sp.]